MKNQCKILIISFSNLKFDPRVNRQIRYLSKQHKVIAAGHADAEIPGVKFVSISPSKQRVVTKAMRALQLLAGAYERFYWQIESVCKALDKLSDVRPDIIIANDIESLPLALKLAGKAKVIFDAHEYAPKEFEDRWEWRLFFSKYKYYLCSTYIERAERMITVCDGIANEYFVNFGVKPDVVTNAAPYHLLKPSPVDEKKIRLIHQGGANPSRKIELMIEMMEHVDDRYLLDLMLVSQDKKYYDYLKSLVKDKKNTRIIDPVSMQTIVSTINTYDIGIYILPFNSFNNQYALPNKFYEFIQARLALAIGPSPEMAIIVKKYDCGIVTDSFDPREMGERLSKLSREDIEYYKGQSDLVARELSEEKNLAKLDEIINSLSQ